MLPYNFGADEITRVAKRNVMTHGGSVTRANRGGVSNSSTRSLRVLETVGGIRKKAEEVNQQAETAIGVEGHLGMPTINSIVAYD